MQTRFFLKTSPDAEKALFQSLIIQFVVFTLIFCSLFVVFFKCQKHKFSFFKCHLTKAETPFQVYPARGLYQGH